MAGLAATTRATTAITAVGIKDISVVGHHVLKSRCNDLKKKSELQNLLLNKIFG